VLGCWLMKHSSTLKHPLHPPYTQLHPLVMFAVPEQLSPVHPVLHAFPVHLKQLNASNQDCMQGKVGVGTQLEPTSDEQDHSHGILIICCL
jgi:hypothetical protein